MQGQYDALGEYVLYDRYAHYVPAKGRRETWEEIVERVLNMHHEHYQQRGVDVSHYLDELRQPLRDRDILGSQRTLQFGGPAVLAHHARAYNCAFTLVDRLDVFSESMYASLCGCGVGFSVQQQHVAKLPPLVDPGEPQEILLVEDSIEGWADAVHQAVTAFHGGRHYQLDFSRIRPQGAPIYAGFPYPIASAPGPEPLMRCIERIRRICRGALAAGGEQLATIDAYDIMCAIGDAAVSGGVRRSAMTALFSLDDADMMNAKTGDWWRVAPFRARTNNSVALLREEVTQEQLRGIMDATRQWGEPGFALLDDLDTGYNPCYEIGLQPRIEVEENGALIDATGWALCNLSTINGRRCKSAEQFEEAAREAAILGTLQAGYTDFGYLDIPAAGPSGVTKAIAERDALLGVSITGFCDSPRVLLNRDNLQVGAEAVLQANEEVAEALGINQAARATCVKPEGSASLLLGTAAGIHAHHAPTYLRRVRARRDNPIAQAYMAANPYAWEDDAEKPEDHIVLDFVRTAPITSYVRDDKTWRDVLDDCELVETHWVDPTHRRGPRHNVSVTVTVPEGDWVAVADTIYRKRAALAAVSCLGEYGELDYRQAPHATILPCFDLVREYGPPAVFASGLIVDAIAAWRVTDKADSTALWDAIDAACGANEAILSPEQADWLRRYRQFSARYEIDPRPLRDLLRRVHLLHQATRVQATAQKVDYTQVPGTLTVAGACDGPRCEI